MTWDRKISHFTWTLNIKIWAIIISYNKFQVQHVWLDKNFDLRELSMSFQNRSLNVCFLMFIFFCYNKPIIMVNVSLANKEVCSWCCRSCIWSWWGAPGRARTQWRWRPRVDPLAATSRDGTSLPTKHTINYRTFLEISQKN